MECHLTLRRSYWGTRTSTPPWATSPSIPRKPSTVTAPSSPGAAPCGQAKNTDAPPTRNGTNSSDISSAVASPSATADEHTEQAASTNTAASAAQYCESTPASD